MDETGLDYERLERRQIAQDQDNGRVETLDVDESISREIVQGLKDADIVVAAPEGQCLVHRPSGEKFDSDTAVAHFHQDWEAAMEDS